MKARNYFKWMMVMIFVAIASVKINAQSYDLGATVNWDGDITVDNIVYRLCSDGIAIIIDGSNASGNVVIPNTVYKNKRPYVVTQIANCAFNENKNITSVEVPNTVSIINSNAFSEASNLITVKLPKKVKEISSNIFAFCTSLKNVDLPENIENVYNLFDFCESLESVVLPKTVKYISMFTFNCCFNLKKVVILNPNIRIHEEAFDSAKNVEIIIAEE